MKLHVLFYSKDDTYINHLKKYLSVHYGEKIEMSFFTEKESLISCMNSGEADILLADDGTMEDIKEKYQRIFIAYLTEKLYSQDENDKNIYIFKYQKGELIYKKLLDIIAANSGNFYKSSARKEEEPEIHLFFSSNGGAGASTVANAFALYNSSVKRVLYLNMEVFGNCQGVLEGMGEFNFDDILYALKSRRGNLLLKLESCLKNTEDGIGFYAPVDNPLNLLEITKDEFERLLEGLKESGLFDQILIDVDSFPSVIFIESVRAAHRIWIVSDGTPNSKRKLQQLEKYLNLLDKREKMLISQKCGVFYNGCSTDFQECGLETIGTSQRYEATDQKTIIRKMANQAFRNIKL